MTDIYYELTKQRTSQSMRMKGTRKAYDLLKSFLQRHTVNAEFGKVSINYFVWTDSWQATRVALRVEDQLIKDFDIFKGYDIDQAAVAKVDPFENYQQVMSITPTMPAAEIMDYLDRLGPLRELKPRPPINALVSATFYVPGAEVYLEPEEHMKSRMLAWLSPTSNSVSYSLHFPYQELSEEFTLAKEHFEDNCAVKLEDKYFYLRTKKPNGKWTFKKLYPKSKDDK